MATREQITTALLTEHLRFTPLTLLDDIINTVNELVYQAVNNIETALLNVAPDQLGFSPPPSQSLKTPEAIEEALEAEARTEIEGGIVKLESLLNATVDKDFDKLEIYTLRNLLTVSNAKKDEGLEDWIMLDHYKNLHIDPQTQQHATDAQAPTPQSIDAQFRKAVETERLQSVLRAEKARNDALLAQIRPLLSLQPQHDIKSELVSQHQPEDSNNTPIQPSFAFLTNTPEAAALGIANSSSTSRSTSFPQNARFTYSQVSALKDIVQTLRSHLASLASGSAPALQIPKAKEERHAYIETQSRRAMERAGVDGQSALGAQEELGRRVGLDEVRALEGVVASFGDQRRGNEDKMEES